ncbi:maestro heat-like repeat-containing protein family member 6 [Terrapene carolina triunguis]|uniref:maestro heat-like repeat-containing protein family member 6 n=1 Tax=Terrapene triunguis TaxID=2587831 RepID=UPI000E77BE7A|nr:maestro heat-like repeat-containing protein family member 6 [Terrapene carolina triunguis]
MEDAESITLQQEEEKENISAEGESAKTYRGFNTSVSPQQEEKSNYEIYEESGPLATVTSQILVAVAGLRDTVKTNAQAAAVMLTSVLKEQRHNIKEKVPEIMDIIYFHLQAIQEASARQAAMGAVCLLAEKHTREVVSALLRLSLPCDSHVSQIWEALGRAKKSVSLRVLAELLEMLKRRPCLKKSETSESRNSFEDNASLLPLAATRALCIIFSNKECTVPMDAFYVSVLIFLIIQLHYLVSLPKVVCGWEDRFQTSSFVSCAVEALKAVIKREKSSLMQSVSLAGGWDLLSVPETYLEGVLLLARAIVKHHRSLDFAVFTKVSPLLHHGDDKQKLTAMALFTELLSTESTYVTLKKQYILGRLKNWHIDPSPTVRWFGLLGLGNVALHLQKQKEVKALLTDILETFNDPEEKVILMAFEAATKIVTRHKHKDHLGTEFVKTARQLHPFLADERHKICCAAIELFGDLLRALNRKDKSLMQEQVLSSMVPLLLNLQQQHPDVIKSCTDTLQECKVFLGWTLNDNQESWDTICEHLIEQYPGRLWSFLHQALEYLRNPWTSSGRAAGIFIDVIIQHMEYSLVEKEAMDLLQCVASIITEEMERVCRPYPAPCAMACCFLCSCGFAV